MDNLHIVDRRAPKNEKKEKINKQTNNINLIYALCMFHATATFMCAKDR